MCHQSIIAVNANDLLWEKKKATSHEIAVLWTMTESRHISLVVDPAVHVCL